MKTQFARYKRTELTFITQIVKNVMQIIKRFNSNLKQ